MHKTHPKKSFCFGVRADRSAKQALKVIENVLRLTRASCVCSAYQAVPVTRRCLHTTAEWRAVVWMTPLWQGAALVAVLCVCAGAASASPGLSPAARAAPSSLRHSHPPLAPVQDCNATAVLAAALRQLRSDACRSGVSHGGSGGAPYAAAGGAVSRGPSTLLSLETLVAAMALAAVDQDASEQQLRAVLDAQWTNGMIPHLVYMRDDPAAFPPASFWRTNASSAAFPPPDVFATSSVPAFPLHATAVLHHL